MATIQSNVPAPNAASGLQGWERYVHAPHFRTADDEFDACKLGFWLFLTTEVLLFAGLLSVIVVMSAVRFDRFRLLDLDEPEVVAG